jgi:hypothetical protein
MRSSRGVALVRRLVTLLVVAVLSVGLPMASADAVTLTSEDLAALSAAVTGVEEQTSAEDPEFPELTAEISSGDEDAVTTTGVLADDDLPDISELVEMLQSGLLAEVLALLVDLLGQLLGAGLVEEVIGLLASLLGQLVDTGLVGELVGLLSGLLDELLQSGLLEPLVTVVLELVTELLDAGLLDLVLGLVDSLLDAGLIDIVVGLVGPLLESGLLDQVVAIVGKLLDAGLLDEVVGLVTPLLEAGLVDIVMDLVDQLLATGLLDELVGVVTQLLDAGLLDQVTGIVEDLLAGGLLDQVLALVDGLLDAGLTDLVMGLVDELLSAGLLDELITVVTQLLDAGLLEQVLGVVDQLIAGGLFDELLQLVGQLAASGLLDQVTAIVTQLLDAGLLDEVTAIVDDLLAAGLLDQVLALVDDLLAAGLLDQVLALVDDLLAAGTVDLLVTLLTDQALVDDLVAGLIGIGLDLDPLTAELLRTELLDTLFTNLFVALPAGSYGYSELMTMSFQLMALGLLDPAIPASFTVPGAPASINAVAGNSLAHLSWPRPADTGGLRLTGYEVRCVPRSSDLATRTAIVTSRSTTLGGLRNGSLYDCQVRARNSAGSGPWSPAAAVRPVAPTSPAPTPTTPPPSGFVDVPRNTWYTAAVDWAKHVGVTTGVGGSNRFEPLRAVTRAEAVTFLWRAAGSPRVTTHHGFVDVPSGTYYDPAVRWAKARGITTGVGGTNRFAPHDTVTRAQQVTFLWRAANRPRVTASHGFVDVPRGSYYEAAVRWAKATGVTTGIGGTNRFAPHDDVNRAQMVTFLHRQYG